MTDTTREALAALEVLYLRDGEDWNDCFERVAALFHADTGYLRPGKDCRLHDSEVREAAWNAWISAKVANARAALVQPAAEVPSEPFTLKLSHEQVQSLYLTLSHARFGGKERPETRPAFGWMEQPLVDIEKALEPLHSAIHDRQFNAMNRQFFGDDRMRLAEAPLSTVADAFALATPTAAPQVQVEPSAEEAWDLDLWVKRLMDLVDEHWLSSKAASSRTRDEIAAHTRDAGMHWRAAAHLRALAASALPQAEPAKGACPVCCCEEVDHRGLWTCRCPAAPKPQPPSLRDAVLTLNHLWNTSSDEAAIAEQLDLCRRLAKYEPEAKS